MTDIDKDNWCELHSEFHGNCLEELDKAKKEQSKEEPSLAGAVLVRRFMAEESKTHEEEEPKGRTVKFRRYDALGPIKPQPPVNKLIHEAFRTLTHAVHANAVEHGWWEEDRGTEPLLLMHTEISEAVEALREGNPESKKIPGHSHVAEELADVVIRVLDYCGKHNINIGAAITAKHEFNRSRPYRHGGKAF